MKGALFHEDLTLLQRDRNAAFFAEEDGARILVCSEIGSEGRNFQFARHLVLYDLPEDVDLLEQRIGRLDRIGQKGTIQVHVPYLPGTDEEIRMRWLEEGLDAFRASPPGAAEIQRELRFDLEEAHRRARGHRGADRKNARLPETDFRAPRPRAGPAAGAELAPAGRSAWLVERDPRVG